MSQEMSEVRAVRAYKMTDFYGDGKADILWQNTTTGWTYVCFMDGGTIASDGVPGVGSDTNWQIMN